jgi:hypothetical protein
MRRNYVINYYIITTANSQQPQMPKAYTKSKFSVNGNKKAFVSGETKALILCVYA